MSEVQIDERWSFVKNKKAVIADIKGYKGYKGYIYADVDLHDADIYLPPLWGNLQLSSIIQSNTFQIANKTAICLSKIAVLLLIKTFFFRLLTCRKHLAVFLQFVEEDKHCFFAFLGYSSGCRSPPLFLILRFSKIRNGGIRNARRKQIHPAG